MVDAQTALLSLGVIALVGLLGNFLFTRTKISDVLLLIGAGILFGPVLRWLDVTTFTTLIPTIATLTIVIIMFDAGLTLKLEHLRAEGLRGLTLSFLAFVDSVLATVLLVSLVVDWSLSTRVLLGVVLGSTDAAIVVALLKGMRTSHRTRVMTILDTSLNDVFVIVGVVLMSTLILQGKTDITGAGLLIGKMILIGLTLGGIVGVALVQILGRLERQPSHYLLTVAVIILLYIVTERLGGAGILAVLMVAIAIANAEVGIPARLTEAQAPADWAWSPLFHRDLQVLQGEVFFFLRSFFFVALGVVLRLDVLTPAFLGISALITAALFAGRALAVAVSVAGIRTPAREIAGMILLGPRGLSTAALATVPFLQFHILDAEDFLAYGTSVVLLTNVVTTIGVWARERTLDRAKGPAATKD